MKGNLFLILIILIFIIPAVQALSNNLSDYTISEEDHTPPRLCLPLGNETCTCYNKTDNIWEIGDDFGDCDDNDMIVNLEYASNNVCFNSSGSNSDAFESVRIKYPSTGEECNVVLENNQGSIQRVCCVELAVTSVKPIQVIEDANADGDNALDFVANKPAMVRVNVSLTGSNSVSTKVKLEIYEMPGSVLIWNQTKTVEIKKDYSLLKRKKGEDTVNFFPSDINLENRWLPVAGKNYVFNATVDPGNEIIETNENDNKKGSKEVEVVSNKKILRIYMYFFVHSKIQDDFNLDFNPIGAYISIEKNIEFLKQVYPYEPNYIKVPSMSPLESEELKTYGESDYSNPGIRKTTRKNIAFLLRIKEYEAKKNYPDSQILGVSIVSDKIMKGDDNGRLHGTHFKGAILVNPNSIEPQPIGEGYESVLVHEYGHALGLSDSYTETDNGELSHDGWCLNQETGNSCGNQETRDLYGSRVNIFKTKSQKDLPGEPGWTPKYFDIMGNAAPAHTWMYKPIYHYLLKKLTNIE